MYEDMYKNLCTNGLAIAHSEPLWRNEKALIGSYSWTRSDQIPYSQQMGASEGKSTFTALMEGLNNVHQ
jgi:hypothetical protein